VPSGFTASPAKGFSEYEPDAGGAAGPVATGGAGAVPELVLAPVLELVLELAPELELVLEPVPVEHTQQRLR